MINRKLLEVLARFDEAERKRFDLFLRSPYFNGGSNANQMLDLFKYILRFEADENHEELSKPKVFEVFYPEKIFKENEKNALDTLTSDLFRLVRLFLVQLERENKQTEISSSLPLLQFYRKYGMEERYIQTFKSIKKHIEKETHFSSEDFYEMFRLEEELTNFQTINNTYEDDTNIGRLLKNLDTFFIVSKLSHTALLKFHKTYSANVNDEMNELHKAALNMAENGYCKDVPLASLLLDVIHIIDDPQDLNRLLIFSKKIKENKIYLHPNDYKNLQTYHRQFWGWRYMQSGSTNDTKKVFDIYKDHLAEGLFYIDDKLVISTLTSLTTIGLTIKEYDWVHKLLIDHPIERLTGTKYLSEGYQLNWAEYYLALKKFDEAQEHVEYKMFENPLYSLVADIIMLRIYYETEDELFDSRIRALEQKIRRTDFSVDLKKSFQSFVQKLDKLNKYRYQRSSPKFAKLVEEIKTTPGLVYRNWLLEKVSQ